MRNLDIFNCAALEIMNASLEKFPLITSIDPQKIAKAVTEYFDKQSLEDLTERELFMTCYSTVKWLEQEHFLIIKQELRSGESSVILTQKGLNALNAIPSFADSQKKSFGEYFTDGVKSVPFSVISGLMSDFFK
ncbi:hypothetical protein O1C12_003501 [Vibrio cholerae]|uniref:hypothetical protein n=1 Tax=Vibrio cholerae TaxID=666 RepID=UPI00053C80D2|nr:hypothetical protein [Vibrio cholerae]EJL6275397.1 hypothetical protein [Vibrio cholerae]EKF9488635.1 hypothetical protein [Vibrio cholerae]ELY5265143.1 hypothetical protein [Vibrio cholerae]PAS34933.1 hypothetical protein CGT70_17935 [Vibrio cholerae]TYA73275.1 hypothetical protein FXE52_11030 [Vibrio cholerae]